MPQAAQQFSSSIINIIINIYKRITDISPDKAGRNRWFRRAIEPKVCTYYYIYTLYIFVP